MNQTIKRHLRSGTALRWIATQKDRDRARAYAFLHGHYRIGDDLCTAVVETFSHYDGDRFHFETEDPIGEDMDALSAFNRLKPGKKVLQGIFNEVTGQWTLPSATTMDAAEHRFTISEPTGDEPGKVKLEMWRVGL